MKLVKANKSKSREDLCEIQEQRFENQVNNVIDVLNIKLEDAQLKYLITDNEEKKSKLESFQYFIENDSIRYMVAKIFIESGWTLTEQLLKDSDGVLCNSLVFDIKNSFKD